MARSKEDIKKVDRKADEILEPRKVRYGKQQHHWSASKTILMNTCTKSHSLQVYARERSWG